MYRYGLGRVLADGIEALEKGSGLPFSSSKFSMADNRHCYNTVPIPDCAHKEHRTHRRLLAKITLK